MTHFLFPGAVIALSNEIAGGSFKYEDYFNSLGIYMEQYRTQFLPNEMPQNISYFENLIINTQQPSAETIKRLQVKLLQTFPFPITINYQRLKSYVT